MNHHAFYATGNEDECIAHALSYANHTLGLETEGNPDVIMLRHQLFSVEDARKAHEIAHRAPLRGEHKLIIIAASRIFHEAQNALLKVFEEPPHGTYLILIISTEGVLIPTLRSRLLPLPLAENSSEESESSPAYAFLKGSGGEREKMVAKLLDRAKSDKPEEKQAARIEALTLVQGITKLIYQKREVQKARKADTKELDTLLAELDTFIPILHERSAPLKLILEHLLITAPQPKN